MAGQMTKGGRPGNRWRRTVWGAAGALLLLPLAAMQVTAEVSWDGADFAIFGAMLAAACGAYELAARATASRAYRAAMGVALATAFLLVWMNLAVGLIGSEDDPANLMFGGVLAVGLAGAVLARVRPEGMARALAATALAQVLAGAAALIAGMPGDGTSPAPEVLGLTALFAALWLLSARLFHRAARERSA